MIIWLLTNTPSPYQVELFTAIQRDGRCDLDVRFMRRTHRGRTWEPTPAPPFRFRILGGVGPSIWADAFRIHPRALMDCLFGKHDLFVLSGQYTSFTFVACSWILRLRRRRWAMWLEQPWPENYKPAWTRSITAKSGLARTIRRRSLQSLFRHTSRLFCIGSSAAEAYRNLGADPLKLAVIPYCCDTSRYAKADERAIRHVREEFRLENKIVFLFSGQLIERKGVDVLIASFQELAKARRDVALLLLGDGLLRHSLESSVSPECRDRVHFAGYVEQAELPPYFHAASVFVLPSRHDGWGVVVNEACAAGLPVIATESVGAARDLVADGRNGFIVPRDDVGALADRMNFFASRPDQLRLFGECSRQSIAGFSPESCAKRFCESALAAIGKP